MGSLLKNFLLIFVLFILSIVAANATEDLATSDTANEEYNNDSNNFDEHFINRAPAIVSDQTANQYYYPENSNDYDKNEPTDEAANSYNDDYLNDNEEGVDSAEYP